MDPKPREAPSGDTDIPVCGEGDSPPLEAAQTGMSVSPKEGKEFFRRNLPHWRCEAGIYWVTFRLADSLPQSKLMKLRAEKDSWVLKHPEPWSLNQRLDYNLKFGEKVEEWLDAGYGSCVLKFPEVREIVRDCLLRFDGSRLRIHKTVIMPNHVHAVMEPLGRESLSVLLKGIKGASARLANKYLKRSGSLWMDESYDHLIRNAEEYEKFLGYIRGNPLKARLAPDQYWLLR